MVHYNYNSKYIENILDLYIGGVGGGCIGRKWDQCFALRVLDSEKCLSAIRKQHMVTLSMAH